MKLYKYNKSDLPLSVSEDEIINKFLEGKNMFLNDKRRELKVRLALFVASSDGYESTITSWKELNQLAKHYKEVNGDQTKGKKQKRR